jgi:hypothetical protein
MIVSMFDSMKSKVKEDIEFTDYISLVKKGMDPDYIKQIKKLRQLFHESPTKYRKEKELLPIITPHAIIKGKREDANVLKHSRIVSVDVDLKDNDPKKLKAFSDPAALAYHRSISGEGYVIYYKMAVDKENHRAAFDTVATRLKQKFGIIADPHVKALSVPRFISYDPNVVYNRNAKELKIEKEATKTDPKLPTANKNDQEQLREYTKQIVKAKVQIVNDRESWIKMAAVYCRAFGGNDEGADLFEQISRISEGFKSRKDCDKVYRSFIGKVTRTPATIGSMVYLMEEAGMEMDSADVKLKHFDDDDDEEESEEDDTDDFLDDLFMTEKPEDYVPVIQWKSQFKEEEVNVMTKRNYSTILGKMKSGKSFLLAFLITSAKVKPKIRLIKKKKFNFNILVFDTEQGSPHVWAAMMRVLALTGWMPATASLRAKSYKERIKIIRKAVAKYKPEFIIIDGIRDLMADFNGIEETSALITYLEKLTAQEDNHIVNILHINKTDENARGHIGTELLNRSETIVRVEAIKTEEETIHKISCEYSRGEPFAEFGLRRAVSVQHGTDYPEVCELPTKQLKRIDLPVEDLRKRLSDNVFGNKFEIKGGELVKLISKEFKVGDSKTRQYMKQFIADGVIKFVGNSKNDPNGKYKILID